MDKHSRFKNYHDININVHIQIRMKQLITIKDRSALYSIDVINNVHNITQVLSKVKCILNNNYYYHNNTDNALINLLAPSSCII